MLWPKIDSQFKSWSSYSNGSENAVLGEHLSEIMVMLRAKFRNYLLAVVEKLAENVSFTNFIAENLIAGNNLANIKITKI